VKKSSGNLVHQVSQGLFAARPDGVCALDVADASSEQGGQDGLNQNQTVY
jgi:hypothetical protein